MRSAKKFVEFGCINSAKTSRNISIFLTTPVCPVNRPYVETTERDLVVVVMNGNEATAIETMAQKFWILTPNVA
jgi:hypothetical protein